MASRSASSGNSSRTLQTSSDVGGQPLSALTPGWTHKSSWPSSRSQTTSSGSPLGTKPRQPAIYAAAGATSER